MLGSPLLATEFDQVESEVYHDIIEQPVGEQTLGDYGMPREFLERAADRVIRSTYQERYHVVVEELASKSAPTDQQLIATGQQTGDSKLGKWAILVFAVLAIPLAAVLIHRKSGDRSQ